MLWCLCTYVDLYHDVMNVVSVQIVNWGSFRVPHCTTEQWLPSCMGKLFLSLFSDQYHTSKSLLLRFSELNVQ
jgi:hypothetical protein